jgi:hypothetical protein
MSHQILIVDDDAGIRDALAGALCRDGTTVRTEDGAVRVSDTWIPRELLRHLPGQRSCFLRSKPGSFSLEHRRHDGCPASACGSAGRRGIRGAATITVDH